MKIYKGFNISKKFKNSAIAIGNFDGFHWDIKRLLIKEKILLRKVI